MSEKDTTTAVQLAELRKDLAATRTDLRAEVAAVKVIAVETREHVKRTNGRVTGLERREIERNAREDERARIAQAMVAKRSWWPASVTAVVCVFLGAAVERMLG